MLGIRNRILRSTDRLVTEGKMQKLSSLLITLGTAGGPSLRLDRVQSSNLLIANGALYVVDAGDGVARRLANAGIDLREIGTIFITHHHDRRTPGLSVRCDLRRQS